MDGWIDNNNNNNQIEKYNIRVKKNHYVQFANYNIFKRFRR